jgi:hypothetical protein
MRCLTSRLDNIEKRLNIGRKIKVLPPIIVTLHDNENKGLLPDVPEQVKDWVTYQSAQKETVESGKRSGIEMLLFIADPFIEYEKRNNLPDGILSKHELKRKIPFNKLLEKATKSNQKQPNIEKRSL